MQRPGFNFLVCPDNKLAQLELERLTTQFPPQGTPVEAVESDNLNNWEKRVYWGDEELPQVFWEDLTLKGLFNTPKLIIVRQAQMLTAESWKKVSLALSGFNSDTWVIFMLEVAFDKGRPKIPMFLQKIKCWSFAESKKWIWTFAGLEAKNLVPFVRSEAQKRNLVFAPGAFEAILPRLSYDVGSILLELDKLCLVARLNEKGQSVILKEYASLLVHEPEMDIFAFIRSLEDHKKTLEVWNKLGKDELNDNASVFSFISLLLRELRIMWQLLCNETPAIAPFLIPVKKNMAHKLGFNFLGKMFALCLDAESGIKKGERSPEQAYEILLASLMKIFHHIRQIPNNPLPKS
ncbi:DNA polymerase III subunit delta [Desulfovibrio litoralis]|uniref:DNA polymerase III, delta subunit n=1 Tax=Desulfovibrio litoralis DSM 11393 TaxID=1121455 RepID=A0A1M7TAT2_9BACT|nr:hypothetical protein [Desulfovibrio litoralis]SHN67839.1 DNA polymerase III, delta subunit [Desulfovibrio litoralis DSM 11393]